MGEPRPQRRRRRPGGTLKDAERRRLARASDRRSRPAPPPAATRPVLWCDGGSRGNPGPAAYAFVLEATAGAVLAEASGLLGVTTVAVAEASALVAGLQAAHELGVRELEARLDSQLLVEQLTGGRAVRGPRVKALLAEARDLAEQIGTVVYRWVPREANRRADRLVDEALHPPS